tara:strand:+ start:22 stop:498 length:477 start_codon:yes stop_codon:yes gene_type:complete
MKLIAHKGNTDGPNPATENHPEQVEKCIEAGYDVEVDLWYDQDGKLWLGHKEPQYEVTWWWLAGKAEHLWIHCKDFPTLHEFTTNTSGYNYFWHQTDDYALTSKNIMWAYPGKIHGPNTVIIMKEPPSPLADVKSEDDYVCYGICSDYVGRIDIEWDT